MRRLTKEQRERMHFKRELRERWNIGRVNRFEYRELCKQAAKSEVLLQQSMRVSIRAMDIRGEHILVVFDEFRGTLVTALPRNVKRADQVHEYLPRRRG
jgi:hypothetical protein